MGGYSSEYKISLSGNVVVISIKVNTTVFVSIFSKKMVYVDDADVEYPIDKNVIFQLRKRQ
jgi:D-alanine-D-alanine ligase